METKPQKETEKKASSKAMNEPELWEAIHSFTKEGIQIIKDAEVSFGQTHYSHAKLETILADIENVLEKHGLFFTHIPSQSVVGTPALTMIVRHMPTGQMLESIMALPTGKNDPQSSGSSITYFRRYSLASFFKLNIIEADDDGAKDSHIDKPTKPLKEVTEKSDLVSPEQFQELVFSCSKLGIEKDEAKLFWKEVKDELGLFRGNYNPETKSWDGTHNIEKEDVPKIYDILEKYKNKKESKNNG